MTESPNQIGSVADSLLQIELTLRELNLWENEPPAPELLQSSQPFCLDTLSFTQWLQFVFVARMSVLVENGSPLPEVSGMAPMAEEHFRGRPESGSAVIRALEEMDRLLSRNT
ncbi:YqcC family protein [Marinobacter sp.]|uniref:YqcC family protein n=1 Tax=Marinobacter sp. TaxID=50741 RepID=UPI0034A23A02